MVYFSYILLHTSASWICYGRISNEDHKPFLEVFENYTNWHMAYYLVERVRSPVKLSNMKMPLVREVIISEDIPFWKWPFFVENWQDSPLSILMRINIANRYCMWHLNARFIFTNGLTFDAMQWKKCHMSLKMLLLQSLQKKWCCIKALNSHYR